MLGNPLPLADNPVQLAEELAMIDMISKGRLVSGFVRGGGQEQLADRRQPGLQPRALRGGARPDLKTWTTPGPFRWEGTHYQHRVVNPWAVPLQKPHPRIWIPGVLSKETIVWAAQHRYPYIALNTPIERTKQIWADLRRSGGRGRVHRRGPDYRGLLKQSTSPRPRRRRSRTPASSCGCRASSPAWRIRSGARPSGYASPENRRGFVEFATGRSKNPRYRPELEEQIEEMMIIAGTPKQVIAKLRILLEETRPGILAFWGNDGNVIHEDAKTCIRLLGQEVLPAVREIAKELGLKSPFETNAAGQRQLRRRGGAGAEGGGGVVASQALAWSGGRRCIVMAGCLAPPSTPRLAIGSSISLICFRHPRQCLRRKDRKMRLPNKTWPTVRRHGRTGDAWPCRRSILARAPRFAHRPLRLYRRLALGLVVADAGGCDRPVAGSADRPVILRAVWPATANARDHDRYPQRTRCCRGHGGSAP